MPEPRIVIDSDGSVWEEVSYAPGVVSRSLVEASQELLDRQEQEVALAEAEQEVQAAKQRRDALLRKVAEAEAEKVLAGLVLEGDLGAEQREAMLDGFAIWEPGMVFLAVDVGRLVRYEGQLYRVVQPHTAMEHQPPPDIPALLTPVAIPGTVAEWSQPAGAHDAYQTGDRVTWNGRLWESAIDANVWEPGIHGWTDLGPV